MSSKYSLDSDCQAVVAKNVWERPVSHWALVSQTHDVPILVINEVCKEGPVTGRLLFFSGFFTYRDYMVLKESPDWGAALTSLDITHWELVGIKGGGYEIHTYRAGYLPQPADESTRTFLAPFIHESLGALMRFEEHPELPTQQLAQGKYFARLEGLDGKWRDGTVALPTDTPAQKEEIALERASCTAAAHLPFVDEMSWDVDFYAVPACHTQEPNPRIMYLFAGVDTKTGRRIIWDRMSVTGDKGVLPLWEGLAQRLLKAVLKNGHIPGHINVRSARVARFLRPLGLQIPFRIVQHRKLPTLDGIMLKALQTKSF